MALRETDPESYITEHTLVYEDHFHFSQLRIESHKQTLMVYKIDFNQNYYTFAFILLIKIVLCSEFP